MRFVRANYPNMQSENFCPFCVSGLKKVRDTQDHLLDCDKLDTGNHIIESEVKYEDLFCDDMSRQATVAVILENRYNKRKLLLQNTSTHGNQVNHRKFPSVLFDYFEVY